MAEKEAQPRLKLTITHYRQPKHTHEAFIQWIITHHLPIAMPAFKRHGILKYALFVTPAPFNQGLKQQIGPQHPTWEFTDADCFIEYTLPHETAMKNLLGDPEWEESIRGQEEWVDTERSLVSLGLYTEYLQEGGKVVNMEK